ncbi:MAG: hypothetical protein ACRETT_00755 [Steroidobacteraceae bacterium]
MNDTELRHLVQRLIREGRLPRVPDVKLLAGYGQGALCAVCSLSMRASDVVYELRFGKSDDVPALVMHYHCFDIWDRLIIGNA